MVITLRRLILVLGLVLMAFAGRPVSACTCGMTRPEKNMREFAASGLGNPQEVIFEGKVEKQTLEEGVRDQKSFEGLPFMEFPHRVVTFSVRRAYQGGIQEKVEITSGLGGGDCAFVFLTGEEYLVYAFKAEDRLVADMCSQTQLIEDAGPQLRLLRGEPPEPDDLLSPDAYSKKRGALDQEEVCGHVTQPNGNPLADISVQLAAARLEPFQREFSETEIASKADGAFCLKVYRRGEFVLTAKSESDDGSRWVSYYPGTSSRDAARTVRLEHGDKLKDLDFALQTQVLYTVVFQLKTSDGSALPEAGQIGLLIEGVPKDALSYSGGELFGPEGSITFRDVPPGHYLVRTEVDPERISDSEQGPLYGLIQIEVDVKGNETVVVTITPKGR